jgi:hypothetical protein
LEATSRCRAGHQRGAGKNRICPACRREQVIAQVITADKSLPAGQAAAAADAVAASPAALRTLAHALAGDPGALARGAPPVVGRLVSELIARGSATLTVPACTACGRTGRPLNRTSAGPICARCAHRVRAAECARCHVVKPAAGRTDDGEPICERCRRRERDSRTCGKCGKIAPITVRARDGAPDICANYYRMPSVFCSVCGRRRECNFPATDYPVCPPCSPRAIVPCARCGAVRPPAVRWDEGPLCDPCYTAALRHHGRCDRCGNQRRLVAPAGPCANAVCEPMIGTLRRELSGRLLTVNDNHLHRVLIEYLVHYNTARPHRTLGQMPSAHAHARPPQIDLAEHRVRRKQILGDLTHGYQIAA